MKQHDHPHSTCLKNRILAQFPDLAAHKEGWNVLLAFDRDLGHALRRAYEHDYDDEAICLAKAANIVHRNMLKLEATFTGSFDLDCQRRSVPPFLASTGGYDSQESPTSISRTWWCITSNSKYSTIAAVQHYCSPLAWGKHCCQGANPLWLQQRMYRKMQMQEGSTEVHSLVFVWCNMSGTRQLIIRTAALVC